MKGFGSWKSSLWCRKSIPIAAGRACRAMLNNSPRLVRVISRLDPP